MRFSASLKSRQAQEGRRSPLFHTDELPENILEKQKRVKWHLREANSVYVNKPSSEQACTLGD